MANNYGISKTTEKRNKIVDFILDFVSDEKNTNFLNNYLFKEHSIDGWFYKGFNIVNLLVARAHRKSQYPVWITEKRAKKEKIEILPKAKPASLFFSTLYKKPIKKKEKVLNKKTGKYEDVETIVGYNKIPVVKFYDIYNIEQTNLPKEKKDELVKSKYVDYNDDPRLMNLNELIKIFKITSAPSVYTIKSNKNDNSSVFSGGDNVNEVEAVNLQTGETIKKNIRKGTMGFCSNNSIFIRDYNTNSYATPSAYALLGLKLMALNKMVEEKYIKDNPTVETHSGEIYLKCEPISTGKRSNASFMIDLITDLTAFNLATFLGLRINLSPVLANIRKNNVYFREAKARLIFAFSKAQRLSEYILSPDVRKEMLALQSIVNKKTAKPMKSEKTESSKTDNIEIDDGTKLEI